MQCRVFYQFLLIFLPALLLGCGHSTPTTYYLLESSYSLVEKEGLPSKTLRITHVTVPEYLDRTGIISRVDGENRLSVAEFHIWAEPLPQGIRRVLQETLTPLLLNQGVDVLAAEDDAHADFTLLVDIQRFDGAIGRTAILYARWTLQTQNGKIIKRGIYAAEEQVPFAGSDKAHEGFDQRYDQLVATQSRLLQGMANSLSHKLTLLIKR